MKQTRRHTLPWKTILQTKGKSVYWDPSTFLIHLSICLFIRMFIFPWCNKQSIIRGSIILLVALFLAIILHTWHLFGACLLMVLRTWGKMDGVLWPEQILRKIWMISFAGWHLVEVHSKELEQYCQHAKSKINMEKLFISDNEAFDAPMRHWFPIFVTHYSLSGSVSLICTLTNALAWICFDGFHSVHASNW